MSLKKYHKLEIQELLEPLVELRKCISEGTSADHYSTYDRLYTSYAYYLGAVQGDQLFDSDDMDLLYSHAYKQLKLDEIIADFDEHDENLWVLCHSWSAEGIRISTEGLRELYYTQDSHKRINLLERVVEAMMILGGLIIDRTVVKLSREALKIEREGVACQA